MTALLKQKSMFRGMGICAIHPRLQKATGKTSAELGYIKDKL